MAYQEGQAICWCLQPTGRIPPTLIPGRIVGYQPGYTVIRVFDLESRRWIERSVRPITLRRIGPRQAALLEEQEATWPSPTSKVALTGSAKPTNGSGQPTADISAGPKIRNTSPRSNQQTLLRKITDLRASVGRVGNPDTELNIRLAYRVLVSGETLGGVGRLAGLSPERVRQRVRDGVTAALYYLADPVREKLRDETLYSLRRYVSDLKPALETAFLTTPAVRAKAAVATSPRLRMRP